MTLIPKNLFQIWLGEPWDDPLYDLCQQTVKEFHPTWEYHQITNADILNDTLFDWIRPDLAVFWETLKTLQPKKHSPLAYQADLLRLMHIYKYGGIYLDHDMFLLKPLDDLLNKESIFGAVNLNPLLVAEAIIGAPQYSPRIKRVLEYFVKRKVGQDGEVGMNLGRHCKDYGWHVYPPEYFIPHNRLAKPAALYQSTKNTYSIHCWQYKPYEVNFLKALCPLFLKSDTIACEQKKPETVLQPVSKPKRGRPKKILTSEA